MSLYKQATLDPLHLEAGLPIGGLRSFAGSITVAAERTGKVDADATLRLKVLVDTQVAALDCNTDEVPFRSSAPRQ